MFRSKYTITLIVCLLQLLSVFGQTHSAKPYEKIRIICESDMGGDKDDQGTFIRLMMYSNELDIKGIILSRSPAEFQVDPNKWDPTNSSSAYNMAMKYLDAYDQIDGNLRIHDPDFLTASAMKSLVKQGHDGVDDGVNLIINVLKESDSRPLWYTNWGCNDKSTSSLKRALDKIKAGSVAGLNYNDVIKKIYYVEVYQQDHLGSVHRNSLTYYMDTFWPSMDGGRWYHRWGPLTNSNIYLQNLSYQLCRDYYPDQKEGDTPTWMHLLPNGINIPGKPQWGSWSGRYGWNTTEFKGWWCNQQDNYNGTTNRDNTLLRWGGGSTATDIQNDFKARAQWAETPAYSNGNHEPLVVLNGDNNPYKVIEINAAPGSSVNLSADGTSDPDGNGLSYEWVQYKEVDSYGGTVTISNNKSKSCMVNIPANLKEGENIHVYVRVVDNGSIPLARYRRAIITGKAVSTNVNEIKLEEGIAVYPNPAYGQFMVEMENDVEEVVPVEFRNLTGQLIKETAIPRNSNRIMISTTGLPAGLYFVHIRPDRGHVVRKLLVY